MKRFFGLNQIRQSSTTDPDRKLLHEVDMNLNQGFRTLWPVLAGCPAHVISSGSRLLEHAWSCSVTICRAIAVALVTLSFFAGPALAAPDSSTPSPVTLYSSARIFGKPYLYRAADGRMMIFVADENEQLMVFSLGKTVWKRVQTKLPALGIGSALETSHGWMYATSAGFPARLVLYSARDGKVDSLDIPTGEDEAYTPTMAFSLQGICVAYWDSRRQELKGANYNGVNWSQVLIDKNGNAGKGSSAISLPSREVAIAYLSKTMDGNELRYAQGDSAGWRLTRIDGNVCDDISVLVSLASAPDGTIGIAYYKARRVMYAFSRHLPWEALAIPDASGVYPALAFDRSSRPFITYYADLSSGGQTAHGLSLSYLENGKWTSRVLDSRSGYGCGIMPSIALNADGDMCIAYLDSNQGTTTLKFVTVPISSAATAP